MAVPPEFIEDLRQRVPLSEIIGRRVKLIRKGRRFSGCAPFTQKKRPLFQLLMMMVFITALDVARTVMQFHFCVKWMVLTLWKQLSICLTWLGWRCQNRYTLIQQ